MQEAESLQITKNGDWGRSWWLLGDTRALETCTVEAPVVLGETTEKPYRGN
jgi:hypothetical protein